MTPRIDDINAAFREVSNIPCCELGSVHSGNGCDLRICMTYGPTECPPVSCNSRKIPRSIALETEDSTGEIFRKQSLRRCQKTLATFAFAKQFNSIKNFCFGD